MQKHILLALACTIAATAEAGTFDKPSKYNEVTAIRCVAASPKVILERELCSTFARRVEIAYPAMKLQMNSSSEFTLELRVHNASPSRFSASLNVDNALGSQLVGPVGGLMSGGALTTQQIETIFDQLISRANLRP